MDFTKSVRIQRLQMVVITVLNNNFKNPSLRKQFEIIYLGRWLLGMRSTFILQWLDRLSVQVSHLRQFTSLSLSWLFDNRLQHEFVNLNINFSGMWFKFEFKKENEEERRARKLTHVQFSLTLIWSLNSNQSME